MWLQSLQQRCGLKESDINMSLNVMACKAEHIGSLLPLACITYKYTHIYSRTYSNHPAKNVCIKVAQLGQRVQQEGQSEEALRVIFDDW